MNEHPLALFIHLVQQDRLAKQLEHQRQQLSDQILLLQTEQNSYKQAVEDAQKALDNAQKDVDAQEKLMSALETRARAIKVKLEHAESSKEYFSLTKELEAINSTQNAQEPKVLEAWKILEKSQEQIALLKNQLGDKLGVLDKNIEQKQVMLDELTEKRAQYFVQRENFLPHVHEEWLSKYNRMLSSIDDPVVPVVNGQCSGCSYIVTSQDNVRLDHKALIECKNCFRLLYLLERMQGDAISVANSLSAL